MSGPSRPPLRVKETDGSPTVIPVNTVAVTNGTLTDDGGAQVTLDLSGEVSDIWSPPTLTLDPTAASQAAEIRAFNALASKQLSIMTQTTVGASVNALLLGKDGASLGAQFSLADGKNLTILCDTPILKLEGTSEAIELTCDENKKLKIDGAAATWVFDASSVTGGLTFPDGSELKSAQGTAILSTGETGATKFLREDGDGTCSWQAASGGGGGITSVLPLIGSTGASEYNIGTAMPWGNSSTATQTVIGLGGQPHAFPFIAPETGTVDEIGVKVTTGDAGKSLYVAIYSQDSNNLPSTLLGYATIPLDSTGDIYDSSLSSNPSLTAGTAYWFSLHGSAVMYNAVIQSNTLVYLPDLGITDGLSAQTYSLKDGATTQYAVPPATLTPNTLNTTITRPYVGIKYA